jgi:hypothetical protein
MRAFARGYSRYHIARGVTSRRVWIRPERKRATLATAMTGTNNDILYSAWYYGAPGNSLRVAHVVAGANTALSVTKAGNDITVNVATNGASAATSTANQVVAAFNAAMTNVAFAQTNEGDGTGAVAAFALTNLTGGQ